MMMAHPQPRPAARACAIDARMAHALADELIEITVRLSELAYDLGSNPATLRRHMASLQSIDAITQHQLAVADILRAEGPIEARVAAVTLEELRARLRGCLAEVADAGDERLTA